MEAYKDQYLKEIRLKCLEIGNYQTIELKLNREARVGVKIDRKFTIVMNYKRYNHVLDDKRFRGLFIN